jgi:hypothetical protein
VIALAEAGHTGLGYGLLAVTTTHLRFAKRRVLIRDQHIEVPLPAVSAVRFANHEGFAATLWIDLATGVTLKFDAIRPPETAREIVAATGVEPQLVS